MNLNKYCFSIIITLVFIAVSSCSKNYYRVSHAIIGNEAVEKEGFYYALPQTKIKIDVFVEKKVKIKGPYAAWAEKYLGIQHVVKQNTDNYSIKNIIISSEAIPDAKHIYFVEWLKHNQKKSSPYFAEFCENGILKSFNISSESSLDNNEDKQHFVFKDIENPDILKLSAYNNLYIKIDTVIEKINIDTITIEKKVLRKTLIEKSTEQKAKEAADLIMDIKESKLKLLKGYAEINYPVETLNYMIAHLDSLENDYLSLFSGISFSNIIQYSFSIIPDDKNISSPLFYLSPEYGLLDTMTHDAQEIKLKIEPDNAFSLAKPLIEQRNLLNKDNQGFYYRLPEKSKISVMIDGIPLSEKRLYVAQLGIVSSLPPYIYGITMDTELGALKKIILNK